MTTVTALSPQELAEACAEAMWASDWASQRLGMRIEHVAPARRPLSMEVADFMLNGHGSAHGGFIFALADSAFAFACNSYNQRAVAHQVSITYMAPGRRGERLTAVAREVYRAGRERHLRRARDERAGRAGRGVPRPLAHGQGNPPAGVNRRRQRRTGGSDMTTALTRPEGLHAIENASRDEIAALQLERMKWSRAARLRELALLPQAVRRRTGCIRTT